MAKIFTANTTAANIVDDPANGDKIGSRNSQLLFGEGFKMMGEDENWVHGQSLVDGYEGYIHKSKLKEQKSQPTHFISNTFTHIYPEASFKVHPVNAISFLSQLSGVSTKENGFVKIDEGWVFESHIKPLSALDSDQDICDIAHQFIGTPYLYGGRSAFGLDCSALVQLACLYTGHECTRDSDMQMKSLGQKIEFGDTIQNAVLQKNDLVFLKGHVGIMIDDKNILNATARTMDTRIEPLTNLIKFYGEILSVRRLID